MPDFAHGFVFVEVKHVDTKLHEEAMYGLARRNPEAFAIRQGRVFKKSRASGFAGIRNKCGGRKNLSLSLISHNDFQSLGYNTTREN
jgi:hypothetical protein